MQFHFLVYFSGENLRETLNIKKPHAFRHDFFEDSIAPTQNQFGSYLVSFNLYEFIGYLLIDLPFPKQQILDSSH